MVKKLGGRRRTNKRDEKTASEAGGKPKGCGAQKPSEKMVAIKKE